MVRQPSRSANGRLVGAVLDRNGLRPCRFAITKDGLVVAGSEIGLVDLDPNEVTHSGRLGPGQMLVVDLEKHKVYEDEELLALFDADPIYAKLVENAPLVPAPVSSIGACDAHCLCREASDIHAKMFG